MKNLYIEAKKRLSGCIMHDGDDAASMSPTSIHNNNSFPATCTYDTLQRPFKPDKRRGRWSMPFDFYAACTSYAFGSIIFSEVPVYGLLFGGVFWVAAYLVAILLYAIPVFVIQTFLGQFSASGTISAFRVAPIFKGIGYSILILNLTSLLYYAAIAAVPLVYAASSLRTVIPWMSCNNAWNTANCSTHSTYDVEDEYLNPHATVEFFRHIIGSTTDSTFRISWPILYATLGIWLLTLFILLRGVSFIGKLFRCMCLLMLPFFVAIFVHQLLEVGISWHMLTEYFTPSLKDSSQAVFHSITMSFLMASWMLGPGWGNILTLASHNHFRRDSEKYTYWVSATHVALVVMAALCGRIALDHFEDDVGLFHWHVEEDHFMQFLYLCLAYLFGSYNNLANFWSFMFFIMLFLAELSAVIIQMMSVLTALFDEYECLRAKKTGVTIALVATMATSSIYFSSNQGFSHLHLLPNIAFLTHIIISLILLVMATWVYGRKRFQCDLQFMLGKTISSFKIFLIRFITPVILVLSTVSALFLVEQSTAPSELIIVSQCSVYFIALAYMIYKMWQTSGSLRCRLKQCFKPHDWHPVDLDNRRFYDELMGNSEMLVIDSEEQQSEQYANSP